MPCASTQKSARHTRIRTLRGLQETRKKRGESLVNKKMPHLIFGSVEAVMQLSHSIVNSSEGLDNVAEDDGFPFQPFNFVEAL